uniref:Charged multivesicular body protein 4c-like isoform X1 n=1 Tax=Petromyzon marinus TaxID=7757 RepID=A0AAJ7U7R0_PETMA|nr:charged multivesicular body protein 4c-like isoform X1 [Petromyzon marinus]
MNVLAKLFGSSQGSSSGPTAQEAIHKLRETEEMLVKKQEFLEGKVDAEVALARRHGTANKRAALSALKRKKRYEKQLAQIDGTLSTIEFQREALENANTNTEVLKTMGFAAKAMKKAHQDMDIDKVDDLMADITEQQDLAQEISDAISKPVGMSDDYDEDELMAELEEMEQEELDKELLSVGEDELPSVPSQSLPGVYRAGTTSETTTITTGATRGRHTSRCGEEGGGRRRTEGAGKLGLLKHTVALHSGRWWWAHGSGGGGLCGVGYGGSQGLPLSPVPSDHTPQSTCAKKTL